MKPSKPRNLSRTFLLGIAVTAIPLAGCDLLPIGSDFRPKPNDSEVAATTSEVALFERAKSLGSVAGAEEFLRTYPNSNLTRSLLRDLPTTTLRRIDDGLVEALDPAVVDTLPFRVKQALGTTTQNGSGGDNSGSGDGYSG